MVLQTGVGEKIWSGRQGMRQPEPGLSPHACELGNQDVRVRPFEQPSQRRQGIILSAVTVADAEAMCLGCWAGLTQAV